MKKKYFYEPIFQTTVLFMTETKPEQIKEYLKKKKYEQNLEEDFYDKTAGSVTVLEDIDKKGVKTILYLLVCEDKKGFYTLIHETHHLATRIMENVGVPVNEHNDEIAAYLQTYYFKLFWRYMNNLVVTLTRKK